MPSTLTSSVRQQRRLKKFQEEPSLIKTSFLPCITPREISLLGEEYWEERIALSLKQYLSLPLSHRAKLPISPLLAGQIQQQGALIKEGEPATLVHQNSKENRPLPAEKLKLEFSPILHISTLPDKLTPLLSSPRLPVGKTT